MGVMSVSRFVARQRGLLPVRLAFAIILTAIAAFVMLTAYKAIRAPLMTEDFPEALAVKMEVIPAIFTLHMISGGLALLLVPLTILLNPRPRWHRIAGRIAALDVLIAGITAFPVALVLPVTWGSALGFSAQALVWLVLLGLGIASIRAGRVARHRACMLLMAATTSGAVFFRIYLALWAIYGSARHYELFYALDGWIAWLLPLGLTALFLNTTGSRSAKA